jgi:hypothetical protein
VVDYSKRKVYLDVNNKQRVQRVAVFLRLKTLPLSHMESIFSTTGNWIAKFGVVPYIETPLPTGAPSPNARKGRGLITIFSK